MKKQVNTMSTSFLDLLSGALGAVILLFVLVPKTTITDKELIDQMKSLEIETSQLDSLMNNLAESGDTISLVDYLEVVEKVKFLQKQNEVLIERLSRQLANAQEETRAYKRANYQLKTENNELKRRIESLESEKKALANKLNQKNPSSTKSATESRTVSTTKAKVVKNTDKEFYFGFDSELSIVLNWDSSDVDIDLFLEQDGRFCDGFNRNQSFGKWVRVPAKYLAKPTEVIIQQELVPGTYKIHAHLARPRRDATAEITGFVAMDIGKGKTRKYDFRKQTIRSAPPPYHKRADGSTLLGTLEVTENNIIFNSK
ncbi:MAG: hypothetical protein R3275_07790 [Saprospiraceae bacterium]|nr:hypothetical protein [Saprospiraceae bacterium]